MESVSAARAGSRSEFSRFDPLDVGDKRRCLSTGDVTRDAGFKMCVLKCRMSTLAFVISKLI